MWESEWGRLYNHFQIHRYVFLCHMVELGNIILLFFHALPTQKSSCHLPENHRQFYEIPICAFQTQIGSKMFQESEEIHRVIRKNCVFIHNSLSMIDLIIISMQDTFKVLNVLRMYSAWEGEVAKYTKFSETYMLSWTPCLSAWKLQLGVREFEINIIVVFSFSCDSCVPCCWNTFGSHVSPSHHII